MTKTIRNRILALAGAFAVLGLGVQPAAAKNVPADDFRTGGCSGCFNAQVTAALRNFRTVDRFIRGCATGNAALDLGDDCDGSLGGDKMDYVVITGDMFDSDTPGPNFSDGFGTPNAENDVVFRVSANGSGNGITCARTVATGGPGRIGFITEEGFDGVDGNADDATTGCVGTCDGGGDDTVARLVAETGANNTGLGVTTEFPVDPDTVIAGAAEFFLLQWDRNLNQSIENAAVGFGATGTRTDVDGAANDTNETHNHALFCDTGFADLPPADFVAPTNTRQFQNQQVTGAQAFKFLVNDSVVNTDIAGEKVRLNDPQIEGLFRAPGPTSVCNWEDVGGDSPTSSDNVTLCIRNAGSGTKETFRNTWLRNAQGSTTEATATPSTGTNCSQTLEDGSARVSNKKVLSWPTTNEVVNCVSINDGAIGYVDLIDNVSGTYQGVVEGVDPGAHTTAQMKELIKCGHYRWWGPLAGGNVTDAGSSGSDRAAATAFETAHFFALANPAAFAAFVSYVPFGDDPNGANGVAFTKTNTDAAYSMANFVPIGCPGSPNDPETIAADN